MQYMTMNNWRFLAWPLDAQELTQQLLTIAGKDKLTRDGCFNNQTGCKWFYMGNRTSSAEQVN